MPDELKHQIHDMGEKIHQLELQNEKLSNGQRYAAINEIEKSIAPLRVDLNHLERRLYSQKYDEQEISHQIDNILLQINELEDLKSDLNARINTETEHARQEFHETTIRILKEEIRPLRSSLEDNQKEISNLKTDVGDLRMEILKNETNREINDAKKFDRFKMVLTTIIAVLSALSMLALYFEPSIQMIFHIFFGG